MFYDSVGLWRQELYGAGEEVREPQGSRALNVRLNRRAQKLCGEVEKRVQGSQDSGAFGSVWAMEPKNSLARSNEDARTVRSRRSGRAVEKRLHGTVAEGAQAARRKCSQISIEPQGLKTLRRGRKRVQEPQGSRSLKPVDP